MDIHPLIVHFPIVCIILSSVFDWVARTNRFAYFERAGYALLVMGAVSAIPTAYTGETAAETAQDVPRITQSLDDHKDLSTLTLWSALLLALVRIHLVSRGRYGGARRLAHTVLVTACAILVSCSAYTGGRLVYEYGAGTRPVQHAIPDPHSQ